MSQNENPLGSVARLHNTGKSWPAVRIVRDQPELAALMSKLVSPRDTRVSNITTGHGIMAVNQTQFGDISENLKTKITDAETTMQLFPDMELAAQILISSIQSPKDMVSSELIYKAEEANLPSEMVSKMIGIIADHAESFYKIKEDMPHILRDVLFEAGSHIRAVIPESALDEIINNVSRRVGTEDIKDHLIDGNQIKGLGILGPPSPPKVTAKAAGQVMLGMESLDRAPVQYMNFNTQVAAEANDNKSTFDFKIEVTDNIELLKLPGIVRKNIKNEVLTKLPRRPNVAAENVTISSNEMKSIAYKGPKSDVRYLVTVKDRKATKRRSIGRPLEMRLPSESVIPVHAPGDEKHHICYFVLVDAEGNPVTRSSNSQFLGNLNNLVSQPTESTNMASALLHRAQRNLTSNDQKNMTLDQAAQIYADIVEADLTERLKNGVYGSNLKLARPQEVYRIMMARTFANQTTRLVCIPQELVTYFAFKYFKNGTGKSLLDDLKILTSLRAIMLFSKTMAKVKSAINITHVNMTLDENDPDPQKTIEMSIHEIVKMRQQYFPLGINSPNDLVDWIQRAGFEFSFEGHPGLPQTKFDFETKNLQHQVPDDDFEEMLRKQTYMALGLSPEVVDNGFNADFATTVISNNILMSKRVLQIQEIIARHVTDYVRKVALNDYTIRDELMDVIKENASSLEKYLTDDEKQALGENPSAFYDELMENFIEMLSVQFPKPDVTSVETQMSAYTNYEEALTKAIDAWIGTDILDSSIAGNINSNIDAVKNAVKAFFLRKWMSENNFMPELADIVGANEDGNAILDLYQLTKDHTEGIMRSAVNFISKMKLPRTAADNDLENLDAPESSTPADSGSTDDGEGMGEDDGMGGGMDDFGASDTPTDEEGGDQQPEEAPTDNIDNQEDDAPI